MSDQTGTELVRLDYIDRFCHSGRLEAVEPVPGGLSESRAATGERETGGAGA